MPVAVLGQTNVLSIYDSKRACPLRPAYPEAAIRNQVTGRSLTRVLVDRYGNVTSAYALRPSGAGPLNKWLDSAAIDAARMCHFPRIPAAQPDEVRRGVVQYVWSIDGAVQQDSYIIDPLESLEKWAESGNAIAAYWLYLRSDPVPEAPAPPEAMHWLAFAASHGMENAQKELERLRILGEDTSAADAEIPKAP
jgi:TonB family protein